MQAVIEGGRLRLGDTVARVDGLHPLGRKRVAVRVAVNHEDVMVFHQSEVVRVVSALKAKANVHADDRVTRL